MITRTPHIRGRQRPKAPLDLHRERKKRVYLEFVWTDLATPEARASAKQHRVSLALASRIAGLVVNLDSFLDQDHVYASYAGLARYIKNSNGLPISERQVRRGIDFLRARGYFRIQSRPGKTNLIFPRFQQAGSADVVSRVEGHDVQGRRTPWPTKLINKPILKLTSPKGPLLVQGDSAAESSEGSVRENDSRDGLAKNDKENNSQIQYRIARRLGGGDVERGYLLLCGFSESELNKFMEMESAGKLSDDELTSMGAPTQTGEIRSLDLNARKSRARFK